MRHYFTLFITFCTGLMGVLYAQAPARRICGTMEAHQQLLQQHPELVEKEAAFRERMEKVSQNPKLYGTRAIITIPVVVHCVYKNATEQITMNDVLSQIDSLNKDFRYLNADKVQIPAPFQLVAADCEIEFCLANKDPQGNPTTGLTMTQTTVSSFSTNDDIKATATGGIDPWPTDKYLNLWVGDLGGGLLGYAQFPGGPVATDGVVVGYYCFGSQNPNLTSAYNLGRTATHEIGHWLGLRHVWGDDGGACSGSDNIADTPNQGGENYGCVGFPNISCSNGPDGDMFMNYMDYSDDNCLQLFTLGQKAVMIDVLNTSRANLNPSAAVNCAPVVPPPPPIFVDAGIYGLTSPADTLCGNKIAPTFTLTNIGNLTLTSAQIAYSIDGGAPMIYNWTGNLDSLETTIVTLPATVGITTGPHQLDVTIFQANGAADLLATNNLITFNFVVLNVAGQPLPFAEGFEGSVFPDNGIVLDNPNGNTTWEQTGIASALGIKSALIRNYNNNILGDDDDLRLPGFDFSNYQSVLFSFDVAYASYTLGASDTLSLVVSSDCGQTFNIERQWAGSSLQTAQASTSLFIPTNEQWKHHVVDLSAHAGASLVKIYIRNSNGYENNLFIDNINIIANPTSINPEADLAQAIAVFPNPTQDDLHIEYKAKEKGVFAWELTDVSGKILLSQQANVQDGKNEWTISTAAFASGMYFLKLSNADASTVVKVRVE